MQRWGCAFLGLLLGVVLTVVVVLALRPPAPLPPRPSGTPAWPDLTLCVSETYLNRALEAELRQGGYEPVQGAVLDLKPEQMLLATLHVQFSILGVDVPVDVLASCRLEVAAGKLRVQILSIQVGGLSVPTEQLPESVRAAFGNVEGSIDQQVRGMLTSAGLDLIGAATTEDQLILLCAAQ